MGSKILCEDRYRYVLYNNISEIIMCYTKHEQCIILSLHTEQNVDIPAFTATIMKEITRAQRDTWYALYRATAFRLNSTFDVYNLCENIQTTINKNYRHILNKEKMNDTILFVMYNDKNKYCEQYNYLINQSLIDFSVDIKTYDPVNTLDFRLDPDININEYLYGRIMRSRFAKKTVTIFLKENTKKERIDWIKYLKQQKIINFMINHNVSIVLYKSNNSPSERYYKIANEQYYRIPYVCLIENFIKIDDYNNKNDSSVLQYSNQIDKSSIFKELIKEVKNYINEIKQIVLEFKNYQTQGTTDTDEILRRSKLTSETLNAISPLALKILQKVPDLQGNDKEINHLDAIAYEIWINIAKYNVIQPWEQLLEIVESEIPNYSLLFDIYYHAIVFKESNKTHLIIVDIMSNFDNEKYFDYSSKVVYLTQSTHIKRDEDGQIKIFDFFHQIYMEDKSTYLLYSVLPQNITGEKQLSDLTEEEAWEEWDKYVEKLKKRNEEALAQGSKIYESQPFLGGNQIKDFILFVIIIILLIYIDYGSEINWINIQELSKFSIL